MRIATGKCIAFCDDDIWPPDKLELQLRAIKDTGCKMSCMFIMIAGTEMDKIIDNDSTQYALTEN